MRLLECTRQPDVKDCLKSLGLSRKDLDAPVQFMYRTARDFLYSDDRWSQIERYTEDTTFDPHRAMLMASVLDLTIKTGDRSMNKAKIYTSMKNSMFFACDVNLHQVPNGTAVAVLDNLDQVMISCSSSTELSTKSRMFIGQNT